MFKTKGEILQRVVKNLPYCEQMQDIDLDLPGEIRFSWRGSRYVVGMSGNVEQVGDGVLIGSDICIVMKELFKRQ